MTAIGEKENISMIPEIKYKIKDIIIFFYWYFFIRGEKKNIKGIAKELLNGLKEFLLSIGTIKNLLWVFSLLIFVYLIMNKMSIVLSLWVAIFLIYFSREYIKGDHRYWYRNK